eukprot:jgi/Astpho2/9478/fgenesh1_pg.00145_%23_73_t
MPGSQCLHGMLLLCSFGVLRCASRSCCTTLAKAEPTKPDMLCTACRDNIFEFMHQRLGVPRDQAEAVWRPLFKQTNQSLKGLRVGGYAFQTDEYWDFIRKDADKFLKPDPEVDLLLHVRACLQSLPQRKWLLTNCNEKHAGIALELLGLQDQFDGVLGANFMGDFCKPDPEAFEKVFKCIGAVPSRTAMFEDSLKNLVQAKKLGLATVLIAGKTALEEQGTTARCGCEAQTIPVKQLS